MNSSQPTGKYVIQSIPKERQLAPDIFWLARSRNFIHGFIEVDITEPMRMIHEWRNRLRKPLSFTTFGVVIIAAAEDATPWIKDHKVSNNRVSYFEGVNILTMVEVPAA